MANEFYDLFNQLFLSTGVWGLTGVILTLVFCLIVAKQVKMSFPFLMAFQILMIMEYLTLGSSYLWQILLLGFGVVVTIFVGLKNK